MVVVGEQADWRCAAGLWPPPLVLLVGERPFLPPRTHAPPPPGRNASRKRYPSPLAMTSLSSAAATTPALQCCWYRGYTCTSIFEWSKEMRSMSLVSQSPATATTIPTNCDAVGIGAVVEWSKALRIVSFLYTSQASESSYCSRHSCYRMIAMMLV